MTNKTFCRTGGTGGEENVELKDGVAPFGDRLGFQTYVLFDKSTGRYVRKETSLCLLLVTARRPEEKLVGRVVVDLAQVLNDSKFQQ